MDLSVGDVVITNDEARWQVLSITRDGPGQSFVALLLSSPTPTVLTGDVEALTWSETECAWRFTGPGAG